jgi:uncharacterized damage-inducible protein DinB
MHRPLVAVALLLAAGTAGAQGAPPQQAAAAAHGAATLPPQTKEELLMQFDGSAQKFEALAAAMPADKFGWSPGPGVMSVAAVYAHVARYNYGYPSENMGVAAPAGVGLDTLEKMTDKAQVVALLKSSAEYVRQSVRAMPDAQLARPTQLYGRTVPQWSVLLQLVAHMNEHLGQSIAYARMNGVVPPWSQ